MKAILSIFVSVLIAVLLIAFVDGMATMLRPIVGPVALISGILSMFTRTKIFWSIFTITFGIWLLSFLAELFWVLMIFGGFFFLAAIVVVIIMTSSSKG